MRSGTVLGRPASFAALNESPSEKEGKSYERIDRKWVLRLPQ